MLTGEIVNQALTVMRERGWCRGMLEDPDGRVCAAGALSAALGYHPISAFRYDEGFMDAVAALERHLPEDFVPQFVDVGLPMVEYNNSRWDFSEIEEWFEKTAADEGFAIA